MTVPTCSVSVRKPSWPSSDSMTVDAGRTGDELGELLLEPQRVEPVRRDAGERHRAGDAGERGADTAAPATDVVVVHRLRQRDVGVGVEARRQLLAVVLEVRLDRVAAAVERLLVALAAAPEALGELELGPVRDLADAAGERHAAPRSVAGRGVVVVAAAEARVGADRADLQRAQRDLLGGRLRAARDDDRGGHAVGERDRPFERALAAHRPADHRGPPRDAELVGERGLDHDLVADRDDGEARAVRRAGRRIDRTPDPVVPWQPPSTLGHTTKKRSVSIGRPGPTTASHQPSARCPGPAGPAAWLSPVSACSTSSGVRRVGVERAPRLVRDGDVREAPTGLQHVRARVEQRRELTAAGRVARSPRAGDGNRRPAHGAGRSGTRPSTPVMPPWRRGTRRRGRR